MGDAKYFADTFAVTNPRSQDRRFTLAMGTRETYQRVIVQACLVAGDESALAKALGVPVKIVVGWLLGDSRCPDYAFLKAVDLVLANTKKQSREIRAMLDEIKRRHRPT